MAGDGIFYDIDFFIYLYFALFVRYLSSELLFFWNFICYFIISDVFNFKYLLIMKNLMSKPGNQTTGLLLSRQLHHCTNFTETTSTFIKNVNFKRLSCDIHSSFNVVDLAATATTLVHKKKRCRGAAAKCVNSELEWWRRSNWGKNIIFFFENTL